MLANAGWGEHVQPFHGGMEQIDRETGLYAFKKHEKQILVATSVAARGLDIIDVDLVVNYKCPDHYEVCFCRCRQRVHAHSPLHTNIRQKKNTYSNP